MAGRPIQAIIFDLGKVLLDFDYSLAAGKLEAQSTISALELKRLLDQSPLLYRYETGLISTEEFFTEVQRHSGFRGGLKEFGAMFGDIFSPIEPMIRLHAEVRASGVPTYLLSNTNALAIEHIRRRFPFYGLFHGHVLSYEHGAMKPDARLYEIAEKLAGFRGGDLLYIDDRPENVAAGGARGWQTVLHVSPPATAEALRQSGLGV
jgi:FMN phosphatase YigB (HAD superfamily)